MKTINDMAYTKADSQRILYCMASCNGNYISDYFCCQEVIWTSKRNKLRRFSSAKSACETKKLMLACLVLYHNIYIYTVVVFLLVNFKIIYA